VDVLAGDLTDSQFVQQLTDLADTREIGLVVHSAGITSMGEFLEMPLEPQLKAVELHCVVTARLMHAFGRPMRARGRGGLVIVSSTGAFQGLPWSAVYGATKAFDLLLGEALAVEVHPQVAAAGLRGEGLYLVDGVDGAEVGGAGDRHD